MSRIKCLTGKQFGQLRVIKLSETRAKDAKGSYWECLCSCGQSIRIRSTYLVHNGKQSCGCTRGATTKEYVEHNEYGARYREKNKEYGARYREKNREKERQRSLEYYRANREQCLAYGRKWYEGNKGKQQAYFQKLLSNPPKHYLKHLLGVKEEVSIELLEAKRKHYMFKKYLKEKTNGQDAQ